MSEYDDDKPQPDEARKALVTEWCTKVQSAKTYHDEDFKRMRRNMALARGHQWSGSVDVTADGPYVVNLLHRQIKRGTASVYAKNPTAVARRRRKLNSTVWDGSLEQLAQASQQMQAMQAAQVVGAPGVMDPAIMDQAAQAQAIIADAQRVQEQARLFDRMGKTLEIVFGYALDEIKFKKAAKQLIRRVRTCGVGYVKVGYQRLLTRGTKIENDLKDAMDRMKEIERLMHEAQEGELEMMSAEAEKLRLMIQEYEGAPQKVLREGLVVDFPRATQIIVDPDCTQLNGFIGAKWIAHEMLMTPERIEREYKVDIGKEFTAHSKAAMEGRRGKPGKPKDTAALACVWDIYDLESGLNYTVCDGYCDFLEEPTEPQPWTEQGHPILALTLNDIEDEDSIYPPSDIDLLVSMQMEYNRSREAFREHRFGNRPAWISGKGAFGHEDKHRMANHDSHEVIELEGIPATGDVDIRTKLQPKPLQPIDPAVYDTEHLFTDMQRVIGEQEANFGGTSDSTATEANIAEQSRATGLQSEVDDIDEFLSEFAQMAGQILLLEMSQETVRKIVGDGAVWPDLDRQGVAEDVYLRTRAGSSGRPNRAQRLANLERMMPYLIQIPGIKPRWLAERVVMELDEDMDIDEAIADGLPSITSMNSVKQPGTGDPATDPNAQGGEGGNNAERPDERPPGPQADMGAQMAGGMGGIETAPGSPGAM